MIRPVIVSYAERSTFSGDRWKFVLLVAVMLGIAIGHLVVIEAYTDLVLGLPMWLWLQLIVVAGLFVLAWIATGLSESTEGS